MFVIVGASVSITLFSVNSIGVPGFPASSVYFIVTLAFPSSLTLILVPPPTVSTLPLTVLVGSFGSTAIKSGAEFETIIFSLKGIVIITSLLVSFVNVLI